MYEIPLSRGFPGWAAEVTPAGGEARARVRHPRGSFGEGKSHALERRESGSFGKFNFYDSRQVSESCELNKEWKVFFLYHVEATSQAKSIRDPV